MAMNGDNKRELIETGLVVLLILCFLGSCMYCAIKGMSYQTLVLFAGFLGTLVGAFTQKMRAGGQTTDTKPVIQQGDIKQP
jgi:hypothetical protein